MYKVLIINSPLFRDKNNLYDEDSLPPIGLGIIATAMRENGLDVELIDAVASKIPLKELVKIVSQKRPDFICTNVFTTNLELVKEFVALISYSTHFIIGGLSTKNLYKEIFEWNSNNNPIDVVCGDGELIASDLILNQIKQIPKEEKKGRRYFMVDANSVYYSKEISIEKLDRTHFVNEPIKNIFEYSEANIVTSRGCIYNCAFCAAARSLNKEFGIREKSAISVIMEIQHLIDLYPNLQSIRVLDDLFLKNADSVEKAIEIFKYFNLRWRSMAHVQTFNKVSKETIHKLKQSGCDELFIGIESGSPEVLKRIHKTTNIELIKKNLSELLRSGINIKGYFIYGFPKETKKDFKKTYELAKYLTNVAQENNVHFRTSVFQYRPYHGTELYHSVENEKGNSYINEILAVKPNKELSDLLGRRQFNFHSGNHSASDLDAVHDYIIKTSSLNSLCIFDPYAKNRVNKKTDF